MATIYAARDRRHERNVAIKVLHPALASAIGVQRFLTEIRVTANLQHPNLLPLFDSGESNEMLYYVMPLVEGETLRARMDRERQLPVHEAVRLTTAIAAGLDYAHRSGIVHRDLKPENILLHEGQPLIADFGIALALSNAGLQRLTQTGLSIGTPRYMSPEQAAADHTIDGRSDIFSLASILFEMLTGDPPHSGATVQLLFARVLSETPPHVRTVRPAVPLQIDAAINRALAKLPADRFATAREFSDALAADDSAVGSAMAPLASGVRVRWNRGAKRGGVFFALLLCCGAAVWLLAKRRQASAPRAARFVIGSLTDSPFEGEPTLTPDGQNLVYVGSAATAHTIFVRRIDELSARPIGGTQGAISPFVSPDGRRIGFFTSDDKLKAVPIEGGPVSILASVFRYSSARWTSDSSIILESYGSDGLLKLSGLGGAPTELTHLDVHSGERRHIAPLYLANEGSVLFTIGRTGSDPNSRVGDLAIATVASHKSSTATHQLIGVRGRDAIALIDDWLLYVSVDATSILAVPFDHSTNRVTGAPISVLEDTAGDIEGASLAKNGTLVYTHRIEKSIPTFVSASGESHPALAGGVGIYMNPRLSPDGKRVLIQESTPQGQDVWIYDLASSTRTRLTFAGNGLLPSWTTGGKRVLYWSQDSSSSFWWQLADGSEPAERLMISSGGVAPALTRDDRYIVYARRVDNAWSIWAAPMTGDRTPRELVKGAFDNYMPAVSPDSKWLAYVSNSSGRYEVYVKPFLLDGAAVQLSNEGSTEPVWSRDGRRLYFRAKHKIVGASLSFSPSLSVTSRQILFDDSFAGDMPHANFDVTRDGKQFLMIKQTGSAGPETVVILDWLPELRARLAAAH